MRTLALTILCLLLTGCAHYEFDILQPENLAGHIGEKNEQAVQLVRKPVEYRMQAAEGHLVVRIDNTLDQPLLILGDKSFIVDPAGGSHPLNTQTIAPRSFIKMILPPMPRYVPAGPAWSIGVGVGYAPGWYDPYFGPRAYYDPFWPQPRYLVVYDQNTYWDWTDEGTIKLHMVYQPQNGDSFEQDFTIKRVKIKG